MLYIADVLVQQRHFKDRVSLERVAITKLAVKPKPDRRATLTKICLAN